jgi:magnesium transporter
MPDSLLNQRVDAIRRLARRNAVPALAKVVAKTRAEDIAAAIGHLSPHDSRLVFGQVRDDELAADVLSRVAPEDFDLLVQPLPVERVVALFGHLQADDVTDLLERLPAEMREAVLGRIHGTDREEVEELLAYSPDSAGGIMSPLAFRLREDATCRDAIASVQEASDHELVYYGYVENEGGQLVGVTSLRNLLTHPPSVRLADIMSTDVICVTADTDQEEVARIAGRYDLLAVPVVDDQRRLLGIVTVDDVIDVIREEAAEDMLLMAGVGEEAAESNAVQGVLQRLPWLMVTLLGGLIIAEIIGRFTAVLSADLVIAGFIPIVMGMEGNVGIQSATLTVRNIAMGRLETGTWRAVGREVLHGLVLGLVFSLVIGGYAYLRHGRADVAGSVAIAVAAGMTAASTVGALVPLTMRKLGVDPAIATGPFVTTAMDGLGLTIYLAVASLLLG